MTEDALIEKEDSVEYFKEKKYLVLDSVVPVDICETLTAHILKLSEEGKMIKDKQCPLSGSIYGDKLLDVLLEDVRPIIEKSTGLNLIPTYSYARKYAPGDELKPHLDRAACEISATLTLGYDGKVWPIHVSLDETTDNDIGEIEIDVGSMVIYRGMEINHWREPYKEGNWQCQVFLHYVDADGPHKDLKYDHRESLGATKDENIDSSFNNTQSFWQFGFLPQDKYVYVTKENAISKPLIESIVSYAHTQGGLGPALIGTEKNPTIDTEIRNVSHCWLDFDRFDWLYRLIETEIKEVNWLNYKFNLDRMELIDYLEYNAGGEHGHGKYSQHIDGTINGNRKLTFSILLSDPNEFEGGDLILYTDSNRPNFIPKKQGMITFFPSFLLHEVTPVTKGIRRSIVSWIHGPQFV